VQDILRYVSIADKNKREKKMLTVKILNSPSKGTMRILERKVCDDQIKEMIQNRKVMAIGLVQGSVADVIMAADVAEKASNVEISEINGNCPQHITMIGVFGDIAAVNEAINAIRTWEKDDITKK
jgi:ethanolamine utilization microcompartment shell protein EutS